MLEEEGISNSMKSFKQYVIEIKEALRISPGSTRASSARAAHLARQNEIKQGRRTRSKTWSGAGVRTTKQQRQDWNAGRDRGDTTK